MIAPRRTEERAEGRLLRTAAFDLTRKLSRINWFFVLLVVVLGGVGALSLYSATGSIDPYATRQLVRFAAGFALMLAIALVDIRLIARLAWPFYAIALVLLALVLKFGSVGLGAERWLSIGGIAVQPSEFMKVALVLALAHWFHRASWERVGNPFFLLPPLIAILAPVALILKEPNLGTALIVAALGGTIFFAAGVRLWKFALVLVLGGLAAPIAYAHLHGYQKQRILTFLNPARDPLGAGYNIIQAKIALGSGGLWGQGLMHASQGRLDFLPEKETDFIFTLFAEQFGFVGSLALIVLLGLIVFMAGAIALSSRHQFGRVVAFGLGMNFFLYVFVNLAMVMGLIPVGGVPLPLVSYGGSALLTTMAAFGILLSVHLHRDADFTPKREAGSL
ncbi:MAG: rod shape-determining protein RodA [Rhodospirillales bacterium]|nr:rod shape-determining protein RodA [Rhodospirillales bacterium]